MAARKLSRIVDATNPEKIDTACWKNVLRHLYVDFQQIKIEPIVDYHLARLRLTMIADALLLIRSRTKSLKRVRRLQLELRGSGRVTRSIAGIEQEPCIDPARKEEVPTAKRYLPRYQKFINYSDFHVTAARLVAVF